MTTPLPAARQPVALGTPYRVHPSYLLVLETARRTLEGASRDRDAARRARLQATSKKWVRTTCRALRGETMARLALDQQDRHLPDDQRHHLREVYALSHGICVALSDDDMDSVRVDLDHLIRLSSTIVA